MNTLIWVVAIIVLQGVVAAIAKKAQANAEAARRANAGGGAPREASPSGAASEPRPVKRPKAKAAAKQAQAKMPVRQAQQGLGAPRPTKGRTIAPPAPVVARGGDSADALLSRKHLAESVARVRASEAKVAVGLPNVEIARPRMHPEASPKLGAAAIARALRNPQQVQQALILGEILGKPRSMGI